jgi:hypothetical protein
MQAVVSSSLILLVVLPLAAAFYIPNPISALTPRVTLRQTATSKWNMDTKIPDFFPSDWGRRGGLGLGEGGVRIPDGFSADGMEKEKQGGRTAVLERPPQRTDPGKKYKVKTLDASLTR